MTKERTFIAIKPDGVQRGYVSEIMVGCLILFNSHESLMVAITSLA